MGNVDLAEVKRGNSFVQTETTVYDANSVPMQIFRFSLDTSSANLSILKKYDTGLPSVKTNYLSSYILQLMINKYYF